MDDSTTIKTLKDETRKFAVERDWEKFHNPKDLAIGVSLEVAEILELFRYKTDEEIRELLKNESFKKSLSHEMADVLNMLVRLADVCSVDLATSFFEKLEINKQKYPVEKVKGLSKKYDEY